MRILHVLEATLAGTRRYLEDVARALDDCDCALVYSLHRADDSFRVLLDELRASGWQLYEIEMHREINPWRDFLNTCMLQRVYREFQPDIVHAHASKGGALARLATIGLPSRPAIVYSPNAINAARSNVAYLLEKLLASRLDVLAAVTKSERDELCRLRLVPQQRVHTICPTISATIVAESERAFARSQLGIENEPVVIAMGRLVAQKRPSAFVDVIARLRDDVPSIRAFWIGDGKLREATERLICQRGLASSLTITGWLSDTRPYVAACDVLVSVANFESFGYATAEALAMERPVVASDVVGTTDVVLNDRDVQLYSRPDLTQAAERITYLLANPPIAASVAKRGRATVLSKYNAAATRCALLDAYGAARKAVHRRN